MLLALDVGNSETTVGVFEATKLVRTVKLSSRTPRTADEFALSLSGLLELWSLTLDDIDSLAVASVVPTATSALKEMASKYFDFEPLFVGPGVKTGVPLRIDNPQEVGADRIANVVGAFEFYGGPAVIVDIGTATTFDVLSAKGEYLGGAIAPGLQMWSDALVSGTAQLRRVELVWPPQLIGKSTIQAIQSGVVIGFVSFVEAMTRRFLDQLGDGAKSILSGGLSSPLEERLSFFDHVTESLTLEGLRILHDRNKPS